MKFSVFTPTHSPKYIRRTYNSLVAQSFKDFEWVIGINGFASIEDIPDDIRNKDWVKVHELGNNDHYRIIGYIKNWLCHLCEGEYLVELDHDDELTTDCLEILNKEIEKNDNPEFLHSDRISIWEGQRRAQIFEADNGWQREDSFYRMREVNWRYQHVWDVTAASLGSIYYSPDHVRVWRSDFYRKLGGHNKLLKISDDHELLIRTYIAGGRMVKINKVLYVYHHLEDDVNSHTTVSSWPQSQKNMVRYMDDLATEWSKRQGLKTLVLDKVDDSIFDLPSNSYGAIWLKDVLSQTKICNDINCRHLGIDCNHGVINQMWRLLVPSGILLSDAKTDHNAPVFWTPNTLFPHYRRKEWKEKGGSNSFRKDGPIPKEVTRWIHLMDVNGQYTYDPDRPRTIRVFLQALKMEGQPGYNDFWPEYPEFLVDKRPVLL